MAHETPPKRTLAMVLTGPRALEPRELPIPEIDDDSALLRVEACGICGSDYEQFEGVLRTPVPVIPGHEPLGLIDDDRRPRGAALGRRRRRPRRGRDADLRAASAAPCLAGPLPPLPRQRRDDLLVRAALAGRRALWGAYAEYM